MSVRAAESVMSVEDALGLLVRQERASRKVLNMVPSENSMSAFAKLPLLLDVYHRYFFNDARIPTSGTSEARRTLPLSKPGLRLGCCAN